jgi:hypothetical protein
VWLANRFLDSSVQISARLFSAGIISYGHIPFTKLSI